MAAAAVASLLAGGFARPTRATSAQSVADPLFPAQWNLMQIRAPEAWARSTGAGVRIGIVDTGVQANHDDLAGKVLASANCIGANGNPDACGGSGQDDNGHGTHIAGIAAAARNGRGIVGVAPDANLIVAKALNKDQGGTILDVEAGIRWVVRHGAQVVNLAVGDNPAANSPVTQLSFQSAIEEAWAAGAIPVVAAGNPNALGPSRESFAGVHALVVGATSPSGGVSGYSNPLGTAVWGLVAPGGAGTSDSRDVLSSYWFQSNPGSTSSYAFQSGASMAVAHVSGVAALLVAQGLSRDQVVQRILDTALPIGCGGACHGRLNAAAAVAPAAAPVAPAPATAERAAPAPPSPAPPPTAAPAPPRSPAVAPEAAAADATHPADQTPAPQGTVAVTEAGDSGGGGTAGVGILLALGVVTVMLAGWQERRRRRRRLVREPIEVIAEPQVPSAAASPSVRRDPAVEKMILIHLGLEQPPPEYDFASAGASSSSNDD